MKLPKNQGLNTPAPKPQRFAQPAPMAPEVRAATYDLHRMAMGVAMQNLMKRIRTNPKSL